MSKIAQKLKCPACGKIGLKNINTRNFKDSRKIYRRKECTYCGERFNTIETYVPDDVPSMDQWKYFMHSVGSINWKGEYEWS